MENKRNLHRLARLEWQQLKGENAAVKNADGNFVGRFADYYLGATAADGTKIAPAKMGYDWLNYDFTAALTYKLTKNFGFTGDFSGSRCSRRGPGCALPSR